MVTKNTRIAYIDHVKAFAILLVVLGHSLQYLNTNGYEKEFTFNLIYSFHMPLFMIMSGLFFEKSLHSTFGQLFLKKCRTLLLPAIVWCVPQAAYLLITNKLNIVSGGVIYGVWFLKSVFINYLISWIAYKHLPFSMATISLLLLALIVPLSLLPGNINSMLPFFVVGIWLNRCKTVLLGKWWVCIVSLSVFLLLFHYWSFDCNKYEGGLLISGGNVGLDVHAMLTYLYRFAIGMAGSLAVISFFSIIKSSFSKMIWIGQHTLEIYVMNGFVSSVIAHLNVTQDNPLTLLFSAAVLTLFQILIFIPLINVIERNRTVNLLLFGKKH